LHILTINKEGAPVRLQQTVQDVYQGGFAGAVFAYQGMNLPLRHVEVHIVIGQNQGKFFGNVTHVNGKIRHGSDSSFEG
jgi:hypothetical protein